MRNRNRLILFISVGIILICVVITVVNSKKEANLKEIDGLNIINDSGVFDSEAEKQSNYIIILTNQSFFKPNIRLDVFIDGIKLITQNCKVEGQHKSYNYYYFLEGDHEIKVISEDGKELVSSFDLKANKPSWNMFTYWNSEEDGVSLVYQKMETPFRWD